MYLPISLVGFWKLWNFYQNVVVSKQQSTYVGQAEQAGEHVHMDIFMSKKSMTYMAAKMYEDVRKVGQKVKT